MAKKKFKNILKQNLSNMVIHVKLISPHKVSCLKFDDVWMMRWFDDVIMSLRAESRSRMLIKKRDARCRETRCHFEFIEKRNANWDTRCEMSRNEMSLRAESRSRMPIEKRDARCREKRCHFEFIEKPNANRETSCHFERSREAGCYLLIPLPFHTSKKINSITQ